MKKKIVSLRPIISEVPEIQDIIELHAVGEYKRARALWEMWKSVAIDEI